VRSHAPPTCGAPLDGPTALARSLESRGAAARVGLPERPQITSSPHKPHTINHPTPPPPTPTPPQIKTQQQLPVVTRAYVTLAALTTALCALELVRPFQLYFDPRYILVEGQLWRLATNFFYFGSLGAWTAAPRSGRAPSPPVDAAPPHTGPHALPTRPTKNKPTHNTTGLDFVFHMFFLVKYCKSLEEDAFRNRPADFLWMLLFGAALLTALAPLAGVRFLGSSLTFMMVYLWGRRHPYVQLSFLGVFNFTAPYLPWVLLAFSVMLGSSPVVDLLGVAAGHVYYFLEDVYPCMSGGRRPLKTPGVLTALFPVVADGVGVVPLVVDGARAGAAARAVAGAAERRRAAVEEAEDDNGAAARRAAAAAAAARAHDE
jgi:Derlin-2/3